MLKNNLVLHQELSDYGNPKTRLARLAGSGRLIQLRRGLYLEGQTPPPYTLAPVIYGPSYLSFQFALAFHGLIPEAVQIYTSASFGKNKDKSFSTPLGEYRYEYLPREAYPYGIERREEAGYPYLIASPEKALTDSVYKIRGLTSRKDLKALLLENWRMEQEDLHKLDWGEIALWSPFYKSRSVALLALWGVKTYA